MIMSCSMVVTMILKRERNDKGSDDDNQFSETIRDYMHDPKELFTITELEDLKQKERTLIERRQNGYYRDKTNTRMHTNKSSNYTHRIYFATTF